MEQLTDKIIIYIFGVCLMTGSSHFVLPVLAALIALTYVSRPYAGKGHPKNNPHAGVYCVHVWLQRACFLCAAALL